MLRSQTLTFSCITLLSYCLPVLLCLTTIYAEKIPELGHEGARTTCNQLLTFLHISVHTTPTSLWVTNARLKALGDWVRSTAASYVYHLGVYPATSIAFALAN